MSEPFCRYFPMIESAVGDDCFNLFPQSPLLIRMKAQQTAYGRDARFFLHTVKERPAALIADVYGDCTLLLKENVDSRELKSFFDFTGCRSVTMPAESAVGLFTEYTEYPLMKRVASPPKTDGEARILDGGADAALYREIYELGGFKAPFADWYTDTAVRVSRGAASGVFLMIEGKLVSMALAPFICGDGFFISAVATKPAYRGRGYASRCLNVLCGARKTDAYLWCENTRTGFYGRLGFKKDGAVAVIEGSL